MHNPKTIKEAEDKLCVELDEEPSITAFDCARHFRKRLNAFPQERLHRNRKKNHRGVNNFKFII